ncbi:MAG: Rpn family recombination-promoting nuclease/putative transposase [Tissierellaceae bacterium]|nr:Rpn family recombination-promoting nuclease/putative transposase [Tissierellaceae bacterium]
MGNKLLSPLSDIIFKALFGREEENSKIILMDFLNKILELDGEMKIKEIIHLSPFNIQEFDGDKGSILDIKIKTEREERINIEVQLNNADDFRKRSLYYWSKMYAETINEGESYERLKKSIVINLLDFNLIHETEKYHTIYKIREIEEGFNLTEDLEIHYIELKKFEKLIEWESNGKELEEVELWLTFIKKTGKEGAETLLEKLVERSETIKMAKEMLEKISGDELLRQKYYAREKARLDEISRIKYAESKGYETGLEKGLAEGIEKGIEKGMEKGMEKGIEKEKREMARELLKDGMEVALVAKYTKLAVEEIENIQREI